MAVDGGDTLRGQVEAAPTSGNLPSSGQLGRSRRASGSRISKYAGVASGDKARRGGCRNGHHGCQIYRGSAIPALTGELVVSDWSAAFKQPSGQILIADPSSDSSQLWPYRRALQIDSRVLGLAEDRADEIYVLTNKTLGPYGATGKVLQPVARP